MGAFKDVMDAEMRGAVDFLVDSLVDELEAQHVIWGCLPWYQRAVRRVASWL